METRKKIFLILILGISLLWPQINTAQCNKGKPMQFQLAFKVKPPNWQIYSLVPLKPTKIPIGQGFYAEPSIPSMPAKFKVLKSFLTINIPLSIVIKGPGIPSSQKVTFNWYINPQKYGTSIDALFNYYANPKVVKVKIGGKEFSWNFYRGWGDIVGGLYDIDIFWTICFDGPNLKTTWAANLPDWNKWKNNLNFNHTISRFDRCLKHPVPPDCLRIDLKKHKLKKISNQLGELEGPEEIQESKERLMGMLEEMMGILHETGELIKRSNEVDNMEEKINLRREAKRHLQRVNRLGRQASRIIDRLREIFAHRRRRRR